MIENIKQNLEDLKGTLGGITNKLYTRKSKYLFGSTIGQHIRHILEIYDVVLNGYSEGRFSFDKRERNKALEENIENMFITIDKILLEISKEDKPLICLIADNNGNEEQLITTYFRELLYCLEHGIHHQALIKVALKEFEHENIPHNFGVAPSTIKFRIKCAQ
ncbi:hypothetical protein [Chryseobacterium daeguense]|uniref:hypothetical protein n=1 Tax=Chryseobacterium daeguense TaxID=412438 RepID=UPI0004080545|nr:hypothetical protein [Chryseobacterium daeguense]